MLHGRECGRVEQPASLVGQGKRIEHVIGAPHGGVQLVAAHDVAEGLVASGLAADE